MVYPHIVNSKLKFRKFNIIGDIFIQSDSVEQSTFWDELVSVIARKKVNMNTCQILDVYRDTTLWG